MSPPPIKDRPRDASARAQGHARGRRVRLLACLAVASVVISSAAVANAQNSPPALPINPCHFGLPPPAGFKCENGALTADATTTTATTITSTATSSASTTNAAPPAATTTAAVPNGGAVPVPIATAQVSNAPAPPAPVAGNVWPVPGVPVPIAPVAPVSAGSAPFPPPAVNNAVPVPAVTNAAPVPVVNNAAAVPVVTNVVPVPAVTSAAPVPVVGNASLPPPPARTSEPAAIVPIVAPSPAQPAPGAIPPSAVGAAPVPIVTSSQVAAAPGSAQPSPTNAANPAAPPIINPLNPIIAPFFNSPAYTQKVQQNLPGATPASSPRARNHLNELDNPVNAAPGIINPGSGLLTPISNTPVAINRDDAVFGRVPIAPGSVEQQGLAIPPQNVATTKHLSPVEGIQGAVNIPVAMSRGARASAEVEDTEQLDLTVRELRARYLRQLRRQNGKQTLRLLRQRRQRAIERRRANGVQVRQRGGRGRGRGRKQNVGRLLQRLARRFNGRGAIDVRQLAKRFRGNPRLQALARRAKGRRVNVGALARLFNRRRGGRVGRGRRQKQVGRVRRQKQARRGRRQPLSLRKIAQRFPRASLDQIARRFPRNQGLRNLAQRFKGRMLGIRQLASMFARRQGQRRGGAAAARGKRRARKPKRGFNLQGLARRFPRLNLNQLARRFPRNQGLRNLANRVKSGGRKFNMQQLVQRFKQRRGRRGAVQARANRRGRSNRGGLMTLFRRMQRGGKGKGKGKVNLQQLARRFRSNPKFQGLMRKFRRNPQALRKLAQRFNKVQRRQRGRSGRRRGQRQGLVGLQALARRFRGNRQLQSLARRFPRGRINLAQLARRLPRNRQLQQLARKLRSRQSKRTRRAPAVRRRQGPMGRSLVNYADAWFKDIHRFNRKQQAKRKQGPMFNAHVVPVAGRSAERGLGELAEMAHASGWLSSGRSDKQSFFGERRARGSRVGGTADSLVRRQGAGDVEVGQRRDFSVEAEAAASSSEAPLSSRGGRPSALGEGIIDVGRWRNSGKTTQEIMRQAAGRFDEDLREPKGPKEPLDEDEVDKPKSKVSRRRLGRPSARTRSRVSAVPTRPINVDYGNDAYQCQCDRAALRRARAERDTSDTTKVPSSKLFRVKLKNHPGLIPCRCVRRGSVAAVRSLRNVAKQLCPARVVPSRDMMRNLAAYALPRVPAQAGLRLRPFGSGGHPIAVLQRRASIKEDQLKSLPASRVHRFGFQSKSGIPLESRVIMARLRLRVQAKDNLPGVCTVKDAAMAVKVGGKLVASRMFPDGTLPEGQVLTLIGRVPEATEALVQGRKVTIEAIVRYREKECLDMTRFEVVHTAMCADRPKKGSREGVEEE